MSSLHIRMARRTLAIHVRCGRHHGIMRVMAGNAGERSATHEKARASTQIHGLVPNVPSIVPVDVQLLRRRRTVTAAAEFIHLLRAPRCVQSVLLRVARMRSSGAVATFAPNPQLGHMGLACLVKRHRAGRVALEAPLNPELRIGNFVHHAGGFFDVRGMYRDLAGRCAPRASRGIVAEVVLHIPLGAHPRNKRDGLPPRAERPLIWQLHQITSIVERGAHTVAGTVDIEAISLLARDRRMPRQRSVCRNAINPTQRERVRRSGLPPELRRVATRARLGADKVSRSLRNLQACHCDTEKRDRKGLYSHAIK